MLDTAKYYCTNPRCKDHGIRARGNLNVQFRYGKRGKRMLYCTTCKSRFSETKCTALFGLKYPSETVAQIIRSTAEGIGVRATARILQLDKDAVNRVILRVGEYCEKMLDNMLVDLELTEVQLDELWAFVQKKNAAQDERNDGRGQAWVWTGIDAKTRLMVHLVVGGRTEGTGRALLQELVSRLTGPKPLFTSDELAAYATLLKEIYHHMETQERTGRRGRPRNPAAVVDEDLDYATVHKTRENGRVVKVEKKIVYGDAERIASRLDDSPSRGINTAYVERMNGILRQLDAHLRRKAPTFAKSLRFLKAKLYLVVAYYTFVRPHATLSKNPDHSTTPRTPAMIAGLAPRPWTVAELLGAR